MGRQRWWRWLLVAGAAGLPPAVAAPSNVDGSDVRARFLPAAACEIRERLRIVGARPNGLHRFVIVEARRIGQAYVQCLFVKDGGLLCEVSSGFYGRPQDRLEVTPSVAAILSGAGFSTDGSRGNFQRMRPTDDVPAQIEEAAQVLAVILHDLYGARTLDDLKYQVAGAPRLANARLCGGISRAPSGGVEIARR